MGVSVVGSAINLFQLNSVKDDNRLLNSPNNSQQQPQKSNQQGFPKSIRLFSSIKKNATPINFRKDKAEADSESTEMGHQSLDW